MASFCTTHSQQVISFACCSCKQLMCLACVMEHQKGNEQHDIKSLSDIAFLLIKSFGDRIQNSLASDSISKELANAERELQEKFDRAANLFKEFKSEMIKVLDDHIQEKLKHVKNIQKDLAKLEERQNKVYIRMDCVRAKLKAVKEDYSKGDYTDIWKVYLEHPRLIIQDDTLRAEINDFLARIRSLSFKKNSEMQRIQESIRNELNNIKTIAKDLEKLNAASEDCTCCKKKEICRI